MIDVLLVVLCIIVVPLFTWGISCEYRAIKGILNEDDMAPKDISDL